MPLRFLLWPKEALINTFDADDAANDRCRSHLLRPQPMALCFVVSRLFDFLSLVEVPVVGLGIPGLGPEFDDVWVGHFVNGFPEVDVHFPVAAVVRAVVEFPLEGGSVPDMVVTLGDSDGVLRPASHDPGALVFVAIPPQEATGLEAITDDDDLLVEVSALESEIVSGSPVGAILAPPVAVDDESLGKREDEGVGHALREPGEEVETGMSFPGEGPVEIGQTVLAPAFAALAPMVLAVTRTVTVTVGLDGFVAEVTEQMPREGHLLFGGSVVPVGVNDGHLLVVPMVRIILSGEVVNLPKVAVDRDTWFPELHVLVDVGGVGGTTVDLEGDDAVDIDLSVASLSGHPVGWELADDLALADGALGLEVLGDASNVTSPGSLSTIDGVRGPDVGTVLTIPVTGHVERVLLTWVHFVTTLHVSEAVVSHAGPDP